MRPPRWPQPLGSFGVGKTCGNISGGGRGPLCPQRPFAIGLTQEGVKPQIRQFPSTGGNILERNSAVSHQLLLPAAGALGAVRASVLKGQLGRRSQHPLPVAVLSELGKSGGPEIKAYFSRDQLILEREL